MNFTWPGVAPWLLAIFRKLAMTSSYISIVYPLDPKRRHPVFGILPVSRPIAKGLRFERSNWKNENYKMSQRIINNYGQNLLLWDLFRISFTCKQESKHPSQDNPWLNHSSQANDVTTNIHCESTNEKFRRMTRVRTISSSYHKHTTAWQRTCDGDNNQCWNDCSFHTFGWTLSDDLG